MTLKLIKTKDGSSTLFNDELNEHYHSQHGAIQESQYVFIQNGLEKAVETFQKIKILEVGFGTGLNALLTYVAAANFDKNIAIEYHTIEAFPLSIDLIESINYPEILNVKDLRNIFNKFHSCPPGEEVKMSEFFTFVKYHQKLRDYFSSHSENDFNLLYYDAFAQYAQPEMWEQDIFLELSKRMVKDGIFVTYAATGNLKRALNDVGFKVEALPGAPGKREMTRAFR